MKFKNKYFNFLQILFCTTLLFCLSLGQVVSVSAQNSQINLLIERGIKDYNNRNFTSAIKHWQSALIKYNQYNQLNKNNPLATAVINENLGRAYQKLGENQAAITSLNAAINDYETVKDVPQVGRIKTELAQVYSNLGQPQKAIALLCGKQASKIRDSQSQVIETVECIPESAVEIANKYSDKPGKVAALGVLGEVYRLIGNYDRAIAYLRAAQFDAEDNFLIFNSLGNAYLNRAQLRELQANSAAHIGLDDKEIEFNQKSRTDFQGANQYFRVSIKFARERNQSLAEMRGLLNLLKLGSHIGKNEPKVVDDATFNNTVKDALALLENLPDSDTKVYGAIDLAYLQRNSQRNSPFTYCPNQLVLPEQSLSLLQKSVLTSNNLKDNRLQSYASGALGHFWECRQDNQKALTYTQNAILAADKNLSAKESLYLWEWQAGRILEKQNRKKEAIESYQRAFETLEDIRLDILTAKRDIQFDFRDVVRPLYRNLAQSRLELLQSGALPEKQRPQELSKVVKTIDALKLAELQNYFGNDCVLSGLNPKQVDELLEDNQNKATFENTVFLSSIILDGKTGILLQSANQPTKFKWIEDSQQQGEDKIVSTEKLESKIAEFSEGLVQGPADPNFDTTAAAQLYDWIIRPFAEEIKDKKATNLVIIQDGIIRSVPMAALYDNQQQKYLVETYAIATTPSLRLTVNQPNRSKQRALILGLTEQSTIDGKLFPELFAVKKEIGVVKQQFSNHTDLIDENFIPQNFQQQLQKNAYPIIHIASHAQFGIIPEDTFIVTGKDKKLTISQLENSLQNLRNQSDSVELLALTACQTALGDDRATLGLAGVALQVGVKSAVASLWSVQAASTSRLVEEFYKNYREQGMSIAQALQKAQIKMINAKNLPSSERIKINYDHPYYWAAMIVIGNWL